jgi:hypothetical protein
MAMHTILIDSPIVGNQQHEPRWIASSCVTPVRTGDPRSIRSNRTRMTKWQSGGIYAHLTHPRRP